MKMEEHPRLIGLCLSQVLCRVHPECEYILQLQRDEQLCLREITAPGNSSGSSGCPALWDSLVCWPSAAVGETIHSPCPSFFSLFGNNTGVVSRNCSAMGWSGPVPEYHEACSIEDQTPQDSYFATVKLIYSVGYGASLLSLSVAVAVAVFVKDGVLFSREDTDHCSFSTFMTMNCETALFVNKKVNPSPHSLPPPPLSGQAACKASVVFCHYCVLCNFFWLLVEALYLNSLLISVFSHRRRCCLWGFSLLGWGLPLIFIVLWIFSRMLFEDTECNTAISLSRCWDINEASPYWWIIKGPIVVSIAVNFLLFLNIIRILVQKLNPRLIQFNNSYQYRRLAKSTLLLIPLFGSHYMICSFFPDFFSLSLRLGIELCLGSFQGLIVAVLYCFLNQEVQNELRLRWIRFQEGSYAVVPVGAKGSQMDTPV
ncbi:hypothetical protein DNTS_035545 [Danionella cerebrum]|uniref:Growth hormone-releasing hormone receptor n=1 Tax=Danionella cerebrum TaxID=2873325 RepID=A0A553NRB1_9TELE|nr:hypothetical protein DNTS_035545 [Danionella translucida]